MAINYKLIRARRRTLSLQISRDAEIIVRAPLNIKKSTIDDFVSSHADWIDKNMKLRLERSKTEIELTDEKIAELKSLALQILPQRVDYWGKIMSLSPVSVKITSAKTRFGSCSGKNGICFSFRLMMYDARAIDYVVVHELAHITHKNHGADFYALIEKYMPDYKSREKLLRQIPKL